MILGGQTIIEEVRTGGIVCEPFNKKMVGPNSIDVRLGRMIKQVLPNNAGYIDPDVKQNTRLLDLDDCGYLVINPGELWLGCTIEKIGSRYFVPMIVGRSSIARMGLSVELSAGLGDVGWGNEPGSGIWTLEITAVVPIKIYAGMRIAQVYFHEVSDNSIQYSGRYANQDSAIESRFAE